MVNNALLVSDIHFGSEFHKSGRIIFEKFFTNYVTTKPDRIDTLIILGDGLDIVREQIWHIMKEAHWFFVKATCCFDKIIWCIGNHELKAMQYLPQTMFGFYGFYGDHELSYDELDGAQITIYPTIGFTAMVGDRLTRFMHGDAFDNHWHDYKQVLAPFLRTENFFGKIVRKLKGNPEAISISAYTAHNSRIAEAYGEHLVEKMSSVLPGEDTIIMGHMHRQGRWQLGNKEVICIGDFYEHATCAEIIDGEIKLINLDNLEAS